MNQNRAATLDKHDIQVRLASTTHSLMGPDGVHIEDVITGDHMELVVELVKIDTDMEKEKGCKR